MHPNVGFMKEREVEKELQFLDILRNGLLPPRATLVLLSCLATSCLHSYLDSCIVHCYHFFLHKSHSSLINTVFCTKTFRGLLTHYFSFAPVMYKLGLVRTLVDRVCKINTWLGFMKTLRSWQWLYMYARTVFHKFTQKLFSPSGLLTKLFIAMCIRKWMSILQMSGLACSTLRDENSTHFYKLPYMYVGYFLKSHRLN